MKTLIDAKKELRKKMNSGGGVCPCCHQNVKMYRRKIHSEMAFILCVLLRHGNGEFVHVHDLILNLYGKRISSDFTKLRFWGLLEQQKGDREDGSNRTGFWRITAQGRRFVAGDITQPKYALLYNNRCFGYEGKHITISDALGSKFNYKELMND